MPLRLFKTRRLWLRALLFLTAWQLGVFAVAGVARLADAGGGRPQLSSEESRFVSSLLDPREADREASLRGVRQLRETHAATVELWHAALKRLLAGEDAAAALAELEARGPKSPHFYDGHTRRLLSDLRRPNRAALAVMAAGYGYADESLLAELAETPSDIAAPATEARYLALILRGRFAEASEAGRYLQSTIFDEEIKRAAELVRKLAGDPRDFDSRLALAEALHGLARTGTLAVAYTTLCWELWDEADTGGRRAAALHLLARVFEQDQSFTTARGLYVACARLLASQGAGGDVKRLSHVLAKVAEMERERGGESDGEREPGSRVLAAEIYGAAAERFPGGEDFGVCLFNKGSLLRKAGHAAAGEAALLSLLGSGVNDQDPSPNITETYRNYRNGAAREIALSHADRGNFPAAYFWQRRAAKEYPFQSWCGTDVLANERRERIDLFLASLKAGPLFVAANAVLAVKDSL